MYDSDYQKGFKKGIQRAINWKLYGEGMKKKFYELGQNNINRLDKFFKSHSSNYYIGYDEGLNQK